MSECGKSYLAAVDGSGVEGRVLHMLASLIAIDASCPTKSHVANFSVATICQTANILKLQGGLIAEQHLGGVLDCSSAGVDEFLQNTQRRTKLDLRVAVPARTPFRISYLSLP